MLEPTPPAETKSRSLQHVLAVDDDTSMLSVLERTLADYRVSTAREATEALATPCPPLSGWTCSSPTT